MDYKKIDKLIMKYLIIIVLLILAVTNMNFIVRSINLVFTAFANIIFAAMIAYVINIIMSRIEKIIVNTDQPFLIKRKRIFGVILSLVTIALIFYLLINLILPEFFKAVTVLIETIPTYAEQLRVFLMDAFENMPDISQYVNSLQLDWKSIVDNFLAIAGNGLGNVLGTTFNIVSSIMGSLFNMLLVIVFAIYLLIDKDRFITLYYRLTTLYLSEEQRKKIGVVLKVTHQSFSSFIGGQCIEAAILGSLCTLGMMILQMPYAIMIGTLVGTINIIPIIGAYIGGAIGVFMVFTVSPMQSLAFLVYLIILQQFESNVIYPRVVGNSVGLPGIYVLASVIVFGAIAGIPGMFLGIPTIASLYKLLKMHIIRKETALKQTQHIKEDTQ
ncbi:AI-2E family transporter [Beduini massiliensis]|uniref:AI-2E family transporter n=1 Tax=Beduini massiliensis TaxID=1585974 RepID=UPI00059A8A54|nr:AI-2E family transporter [Beduini massiliensis]